MNSFGGQRLDISSNFSGKRSSQGDSMVEEGGRGPIRTEPKEAVKGHYEESYNQ